ncbi:hypothetical protein ACQUW5_09105 [Legionella sp. CNM-1927-20]|uniref:hypothetical protein n=1 Tax=Legionella sp. CNM-1927-20 TaxID=3422221 RepID=UPI00403A99CE
MVRKIVFLMAFLATLFVTIGYASKLSKYLNQMDAQDWTRQEREWQQDMNFNDFALHYPIPSTFRDLFAESTI